MSNTMKEYGQVVGIKGGAAKVKFIRTSACGHCHACGMLSMQNEIVVEVENTLGVVVGDLVMVSIRMKKAVRATMIAYLVPLAMLIAGAALGWVLSSALHWFENTDVTMALCALAFAVLSFPLLKAIAPFFSDTVSNVYTMIEKKQDENMSGGEEIQ